MVIGAYQADPSGSMSGEAYVVFGSVGWTASAVDLADLGAGGGLTFAGSARRSYLGHSVAGAGGMRYHTWELFRLPDVFRSSLLWLFRAVRIRGSLWFGRPVGCFAQCLLCVI